ncbi:MAG TPA: hypothetical protein VLA72_07100 [Anaerolineales bacterium]|nr:hypothetical protein [Anaerolineales bacterium]
MSQIVFRGKTYNSVFEMPDDIRKAYQIEKRKQPAQNNLTDFVDMSDEIREMYERARGAVSEKPASSQPLSDLPSSDEIFRRSARSEEDMYRPSNMPEAPMYQAIEEDNSAGRLALIIGVLVLLAGIAAFFFLQ